MSLGVKTWSLIPVLLVARLLFGQTDTSNDMKHGIVTGTVVENKSGAPLRKAVVIIRHEQEEGTGASTDALGKFTLRDIDPGTYQVTVERATAQEKKRWVAGIRCRHQRPWGIPRIWYCAGGIQDRCFL